MKISRGCAVITGGAYGIGRATARELAKDGWAVLIVDTNAASAHTLLQDLLADQVPAAVVIGDVTKGSTYDRVQDVAQGLGPIQGLVTCAAMRHAGRITEITPDQWRETVDVVLNGVFTACHALIPEMIRAGKGSIVNVSSPDGFGRRDMVAYASAKAAVNTLSDCLAMDHLQDGIRVNVVLPVFTKTGMTEHYSEERLAALAARSVAKRVAEPEDIAKLIRFLMSDEAEVMTGGRFGPSGRVP